MKYLKFSKSGQGAFCFNFQNSFMEMHYNDFFGKFLKLSFSTKNVCKFRAGIIIATWSSDVIHLSRKTKFQVYLKSV